MNDRFKFRAWNPERNDFIYNIQDVGSDFSIRCLEDCFGDFLFNEDYIIEQCTGLKDKNGKLIYEGDIVKTDSGSIYFIQWDKKTSSFREEDPNLSDVVYNAGHHLSLWSDFYCKSYTIIGNIHENPELLED